MTIASLLLAQLTQYQDQIRREQERQEALQVAAMAVQTGQSDLTLNGFRVQVIDGEEGLVIYAAGEEVLRLEQVP